MDDSPPPAYSREYNGPAVDGLPLARNQDGTDTTRNASKRAEGRDIPRPLPRLPVGETTSLKTGIVSPLRLHKKSQSTATFPSVERPWKPPSLDGGPPSHTRWNPTTPNSPQFRHREAEFAQSPPSQYSRTPPHTPTLLEHGRKASGHYPMSIPSRARETSLPPTQMPAVDPNAFYNPAVSGHLSRPSMSHTPRSAAQMDIRPNQPPNNNPSRSGHVRWA